MAPTGSYFETVCFDLDDTLIANTYKYHAPIWRCGLLITEALGEVSIYPPDLMDMRVKIDAELMETLGFAVERFPESWVQTYRRLCERFGKTPDPDLVARLREEAMRFQEGPFDLFDGVAEMLADLRNEGRLLCLVTAGAPDLQWRKIDSSGLEKHFNVVHVTPHGKKDFLQTVIGKEPARTMMVGDSKRSDIMPALELGLTAVHVESETWHYAHAEVAGEFHRVASVRELPELIARLERERS